MSGRCFIVGGGPSLTGFNFQSLKNEDTIVTNKSLFDVPSPNYFITVDYSFVSRVTAEKIRSYPGKKIFILQSMFPFMKWIDGRPVDTRFNFVYNLDVFDQVVECFRADGIGHSFDDFRSGENSGYCALQLAVLLGYDKIFLLGFDLGCAGKQTHYHNGYGHGVPRVQGRMEFFAQYFHQGLQQLSSQTGIQVFSCSSTSSLNTTIPYIPIDQVL